LSLRSGHQHRHRQKASFLNDVFLIHSPFCLLSVLISNLLTTRRETPQSRASVAPQHAKKILSPLQLKRNIQQNPLLATLHSVLQLFFLSRKNLFPLRTALPGLEHKQQPTCIVRLHTENTPAVLPDYSTHHHSAISISLSPRQQLVVPSILCKKVAPRGAKFQSVTPDSFRLMPKRAISMAKATLQYAVRLSRSARQPIRHILSHTITHTHMVMLEFPVQLFHHCLKFVRMDQPACIIVLFAQPIHSPHSHCLSLGVKNG
jgi:hypothetical protein